MTRTTALAAAAVAAAAAAIAAPAGATTESPSATTAAALPSVNHEAVLKAAQLDPKRPSTTPFAESKASVLHVERALNAKGLLAQKWVDGYFGSTTTTAWKAWEKRVHPSAGPALNNGLPGVSELRTLGSSRFTVTRAVDPGGWVKEDGEVINTRTRAMFRKAEQLSGTNMVITQGRGDASASAGTHRGGGTIDIRTKDAPAKVNARIAALRKVGFAAWYRDWSGNEHIHAVALSDSSIAEAAWSSICQPYQYWKGGEGLSCSNSTAGKDRPWVTWESYQR